MFRTKILSLTAIILLSLAGVIYAGILNIPDEYQTIQSGINAASNTDTVLVQPGVYVENIDFSGGGFATWFTAFEITDVEIRSNDADSYGGGFYLYDQRAMTTYVNGIVENNSFSNGGSFQICGIS